jgi:hypothetical protein
MSLVLAWPLALLPRPPLPSPIALSDQSLQSTRLPSHPATLVMLPLPRYTYTKASMELGINSTHFVLGFNLQKIKRQL